MELTVGFVNPLTHSAVVLWCAKSTQPSARAYKPVQIFHILFFKDWFNT